MNFGTPDWGCDETTAAEIVHVFRDAGGNFFDTADIYGAGDSERVLGRLLAGSRDDVVIASKAGFPMPGDEGPRLTPERIRASLLGTLERLGTDHLDLLQLHAFDPVVPLSETLGGIDELVREGLVRHGGSSNFFAWQLAHADAVATERGLPRLASAQMMYSLIRRDIEREHIAYAQASGLALIAYGPLHGGHLAAGWQSPEELPADSRAVANPDVYLADAPRVFAVARAVVEHAARIGATPGQVALGWTLRAPGITTTLTAARTADELREQLCALTLDADDGFWASLDGATALPPSYPSDFYARLVARNT
jgi:aryl-alcohol dehydrogenase-like predicted oxidoreductase